jgi:SpoVK/Ycf46/Vps4 family AAA+-type ATPase
MESLKDELKTRIFSAGFPAIFLQTPEDRKTQLELLLLGQEIGYNIFTWSAGKGLVKTATAREKEGKTSFHVIENEKVIEDTGNPLDVLIKIMDTAVVPPKSIINLRLFHSFLEDPGVQTMILDLCKNFKVTERAIVITSPTLSMPAEIEKELCLVECPLPDAEQIGLLLDGILEANEEIKKSLTEKNKTELIKSALGLTSPEAENAFSLAYAKGKGKGWDTSIVVQEKCNAIKKSGILEFVENKVSGLDDIGGLYAFKEWARKRKKSFSEKARKFGLLPPKAVLMVGVPGTGKSMMAACLAAEFELPLIKLDVGRIFGSLVGQSEANLRNALKTAEAIAPAVLFIDEIEKGFSSNSGETDGGTSTRVLGHFLTWMQEQNKLLVFATANKVESLPPEMLRMGRWDLMTGLTLPNNEERSQIWQIHLNRVGRSKLIGKSIEIEELVVSSEGYTGAEIEAAVKEAMFAVFDQDEDLNTFELKKALKAIIPLSQMMPERISSIEQWCKGHAVLASGPVKPSTLTDPRSEVANMLQNKRIIKTKQGDN